MDATRARFGSLLEWILAAICIAATLALGSVAVGGFRTVSAVTPAVAADAPLADPPATVPSRAVSVPVLLLSNGVEVRVGDAAAEVAAHLGSEAAVGTPSVDRTPMGERVTRFTPGERAKESATFAGSSLHSAAMSISAGVIVVEAMPFNVGFASIASRSTRSCSMQ
jgi:hypothetical protein